MKDFELEIPDWREFLVAKAIKHEAMLQTILYHLAKTEETPNPETLLAEPKPEYRSEPSVEKLKQIENEVNKCAEEIALKWKAD